MSKTTAPKETAAKKAAPKGAPAKGKRQALTHVRIAGHDIPVLPTLDDLPREPRRWLGHAQFALGTVAAGATYGTLPPATYEALLQYAATYAQSQGVEVDLKGEMSARESARLEAELVLAGTQLVNHFNAATADSESDSKNDGEDDRIETGED